MPSTRNTGSEPTSGNPKDPTPSCLGKMKYWQQVKHDLPKEILNFSEDIMDNIITYVQLHDLALKCDIPRCWVERAKEDYPHDSEIMVTKVFFKWWGRSPLNTGKKSQLIQAAFVYMGKPAIFQRIIGKYPELEMLLEYARSGVTLALPSGDGAIRQNMTDGLDNSHMPSLEYVRTGQISAADYEVICQLSMVIQSECNYMSICDSLGIPLEYGPQAKPKFGTWMLQTEVTLMKFCAKSTSFLCEMANVWTAFNACGCLTFCNEILVSMGHRISVINEHASVHNPPKVRSSSDSSLRKLRSGEKEKGSPKTSRDMQEDSAEDSLETAEQMHSVTNKVVRNNKASHPGKSSIKNSAQNFKAVIEFEDVSYQTMLNDKDIQGIILLIFERDEVDGRTPREILQKLNPKVVLEDVHKDK